MYICKWNRYVKPQLLSSQALNVVYIHTYRKIRIFSKKTKQKKDKEEKKSWLRFEDIFISLISFKPQFTTCTRVIHKSKIV